MPDEIILTPKDITNAIQIIDICVKRGAIEGSELSAVGTVRDRLESFVKQEAEKNSEEEVEENSEQEE